MLSTSAPPKRLRSCSTWRSSRRAAAVPLAVKMLLEHVWPVGRDRPMKIAVPEINGTRDLLPAGAALTNAVFAGEATAQEGAAAARVLKAHMQAIELVDIEQALSKLEQAAEEREKQREARGIEMKQDRFLAVFRPFSPVFRRPASQRKCRICSALAVFACLPRR